MRRVGKGLLWVIYPQVQTNSVQLDKSKYNSLAMQKSTRSASNSKLSNILLLDMSQWTIAHVQLWCKYDKAWAKSYTIFTFLVQSKLNNFIIIV